MDTILSFVLAEYDSYLWIKCTHSACDWRERFNFSSTEFDLGNGQILRHALHHRLTAHNFVIDPSDPSTWRYTHYKATQG